MTYNMIVYTSPSFGSTSRIYIYAKDEEAPQDSLRKAMEVFSSSSVWGGVDKSEFYRDSYSTAFLSIEVPLEMTDGISYAICRYLKAQRGVSVAFCSSIPCFESNSNDSVFQRGAPIISVDQMIKLRDAFEALV